MERKGRGGYERQFLPVWSDCVRANSFGLLEERETVRAGGNDNKMKKVRRKVFILFFSTTRSS